MNLNEIKVFTFEAGVIEVGPGRFGFSPVRDTCRNIPLSTALSKNQTSKFVNFHTILLMLNINR